MFTNEFIVAMREKMRTQYPDEYQRMLMPRTLNKTYSVGMTEKFWVNVDAVSYTHLTLPTILRE